MASHVEYQLLSKIIADEAMREALEEGLKPKHFQVAEARGVFDYLLGYYTGRKTRNMVPDRKLLYKDYGTVDLPRTRKSWSIPALCKVVKDDWLRKKIDEIKNSPDTDKEPAEELEQIITDFKTLQTSSVESRDILMGDSGDDIYSDYQRAKSADSLEGIPYPIGWGYHDGAGKPLVSKKTGRQDHPLNDQTQGMLDGEFILIYGRPKSMKTWLLTDMITESYYYNRCRTLVFSKEMTPKQMRTRAVARILGVDYLQLRNGELSEDEEEELQALTETLKSEESRYRERGKDSGILFTQGWKEGSVDSGLNSLQAKIEQFEPDIVFADAIYLLKPMVGNSSAFWQEIGAIAYGLKEMANQFNVPIVATSQANRQGEELRGSSMREIAYGDTLAQACDLAMRIIPITDEDNNVSLAAVISGAREIKLEGFQLDVEIAKKFQLTRVFENQMQVQALFRAEEEAAAQEEQRQSTKIAEDKRASKRNYEPEPADREEFENRPGRDGVR